MRVLAMLHAYVPAHGAGAETMAHALFRHLVAQGHEVDVVLSKLDPQVPTDYEFEGVNVYTYQGKTQVPSRLVGDVRPHVIVCHLENTPRAAALGQMNDIPVVQLLHNERPETLHSTVRWPFSLLVANSDWLAERYRQHWAEEENPRHGEPPIVRVHPPVDPKEYATIPGNRITLVNLTIPKGAHVFYALAQRLPQYKFLGVRGAYGDQVIRDDLPNVDIINNVPSHEVTKHVYGQTKVLLVPSDYETYGRVAVEAMCSGIPVIAHPTPGLRESLGTAGIFHDRNDLGAWQTELRRLHTPRGWAASSKVAKARAAELDPTPQLERWRTAMEEAASVLPSARHGR